MPPTAASHSRPWAPSPPRPPASRRTPRFRARRRRSVRPPPARRGRARCARTSPARRPAAPRRAGPRRRRPPAGGQGRSAGTYALLIGLAVLILGGGAFFVSQLGGSDEPTQPNQAAAPAAETPAATSTGTRRRPGRAGRADDGDGPQRHDHAGPGEEARRLAQGRRLPGAGERDEHARPDAAGVDRLLRRRLPRRRPAVSPSGSASRTSRPSTRRRARSRRTPTWSCWPVPTKRPSRAR